MVNRPDGGESEGVAGQTRAGTLDFRSPVRVAARKGDGLFLTGVKPDRNACPGVPVFRLEHTEVQMRAA